MFRLEGRAALQGAFGKALRVQACCRDGGSIAVVLGLLQFIIYHKGTVKLIISSLDDGIEGAPLSTRTHWVHASDVVRIEECLELSISDPTRLTRHELHQVFHWISGKQESEMLDRVLSREVVSDDEDEDWDEDAPTEDEKRGEERRVQGNPSGSETSRSIQELLDALGVAERESEEGDV